MSNTLRYFFLVLCFVVVNQSLFSQTNPRFNVNLSFDYSAADQTISLLDGNQINTTSLAELRGNRIAASTTGLIANRRSLTFLLQSYLDSLRYRDIIKDDIFHLETARKNVDLIKQLYLEIVRRNFNNKVVATVEQIFPSDAEVNITIPVYVVAVGHDNVDAYVRRIIWRGDVPEFVGEGEGELTIVINLAQSVNYGDNVEERMINLLGVVAHEVFHAAFGAYKDQSPTWKRYYRNHQSTFDILIDLMHNEGIAYYLSLEQRGRGYLPREWSSKTREAFTAFNSNAKELLSPSLKPYRAEELLRTANLSGYWESYGSMTGMFMAREIDMRLGRAALIETIGAGPADFFQKYFTLSERDSNLPKIPTSVFEAIGVK